MMEIWKDIMGTKGKYLISNTGNVKSLFFKKPRNLKLIKQKNGYLSVSLQMGATVKREYVHRIVANNFIEGTGNTVNHIDGNKENNKVDNLEWCTSSENNHHAWDTGLMSREKRSKLNRCDVDKIRGLRALGLNGMEISRALSLPKTPVYWVIQEKTWDWYKSGDTK